MKRLYRSRQNTIIGGVCGGFGEYFDIDPTIIRIIFVLLTGTGIIPYIILWIILPYEGQETNTPSETIRLGTEEIGEKAQNLGKTIQNNRSTGILFGTVLIIIGGLIILKNLGLFWFDWGSLKNLWPLLLIFFGVKLLIRRKDRE